MSKILVVDDSPTIGSTVEWLLANNGYEVRVVQDGLSTLNAMRAFNPDLILLDIRLEHIDGFELCSMIRASRKYKTKPVVMLSGLSDQDSIARALECGANAYITKPVRDDEVLGVITEQLNIARRASA